MTPNRSTLLVRSGLHLGGRHIVRREHAPRGQMLAYRRAAGESPARMTAGAEAVRRFGWSVAVSEQDLGAMLLGLGLVQAMADATTHAELRYSGPCPELIRLCSLQVRARRASGPHILHTGTHEPVRFQAIAEHAPVWLDMLDKEHIEVHTALPMRFYLAAEEFLGIRLPATHAPAPTFLSSKTAQPFHVVFAAIPQWPSGGSGISRYVQIARTLSAYMTAPWTFSLIATPRLAEVQLRTSEIEFDVFDGTDIASCVDLFASADLVVGKNCGLTHLAGLTERPNGTGPHVIGLHAWHPHSTPTTGRDRHHIANVASLPIEEIAYLAGRLTEWW